MALAMLAIAASGTWSYQHVQDGSTHALSLMDAEEVRRALRGLVEFTRRDRERRGESISDLEFEI